MSALLRALAAVATLATPPADAPTFVPQRLAFEATATLPPSRAARYDAANLGDGDPATAWCEGEPRTTAGVGFRARLEAPRAGRAIELAIANGYQKSAATLQANAAPRQLRARVLAPSFEIVAEEVLALAREPGAQRFVLALPEGAVVAAVGFEIVSFHDGARYLDACVSDVAVALSDAPPRPTADAAPRRLSEFDGWRGFRLERDRDGAVTVVFPREFGRANAKDLAIVTRLITHGYDVDGDLSPMSFEYPAIAQLRRLAVEYQDRAAAEVIVRADTEGGIDLGGGELSEEYAYELLAPLLVGYRDLASVLPKELEDRTAEAVCAGAYRSASGDAVDEQQVIRALEARGLRALAGKIRRACKAMAEPPR